MPYSDLEHLRLLQEYLEAIGVEGIRNLQGATEPLLNNDLQVSLGYIYISPRSTPVKSRPPASQPSSSNCVASLRLPILFTSLSITVDSSTSPDYVVSSQFLITLPSPPISINSFMASRDSVASSVPVLVLHRHLVCLMIGIVNRDRSFPLKNLHHSGDSYLLGESGRTHHSAVHIPSCDSTWNTIVPSIVEIFITPSPPAIAHSLTSCTTICPSEMSSSR